MCKCDCRSEVEGTPDVLMCLFLFLKMFLEFRESSLQVAIYFDVPRDDPLHATDILVNIVFDRAHSLYIRYQLTLFGEELGCLLQVLEVAVKEFFLFFYNSVDFFVESKEFLGINHVLTRATAHARLAEPALTSLAFIGTGSQGVLKVVPVLLLFLLELFFVTKLLIISGDLVLRWSQLGFAGGRRHHVLPCRSFFLLFRGFICSCTLRNNLLLRWLWLLLGLRGLLLGRWQQHSLRGLLFEDLRSEWLLLLWGLLVTNGTHVCINLRVVRL